MRHLLAGLAFLAVPGGAAQLCAQTTVTLEGSASPGTAEPGVTSITLIGYGFPSGSIPPANVTVTFQPKHSGNGPRGTTQATSIQPLFGTTVQLTFTVPTTITVHQAVNYLVSIAGSTSTGASFSSGNTAALQITAAAQITGISPNSGSPGVSLQVTITAANTSFFQGATEANFGPGISVGGAPPGEFGPVTVNNLSSATAQLTIGIPLNFGTNPVTVATGTEQAPFSSGFIVTNFSRLHSFVGPPSDGANPKRAPIIGPVPGGGSAIYAVTPYGGTGNFGTIFSYPLTFGPNISVLYNFAGPPNDGQTPDGALVLASNGVLYGTTGGGGSHAPSGIVYSLTPPASPGGAWTENVLYNFQGGPSDGANSYSAPIIAGESGGLPILYGTTFNGGTRSFGVAFSLTPPANPGGAWTESILHLFTGAPHDGANPHTALTPGPGGVYYGTTYYGGASNNGTVFQLTPPTSPDGQWTESVLYSFAGQPTDGANPHGDLIVGPGGVIYSTTLNGGPKGFGTVFSLTPPTSPGGQWTESLLYEFAGQPDAVQPRAGLVMSTGPGGQLIFYSTTYYGGTYNTGTVFSLTQPASPGGQWTETVLYSLGNFDGSNLEAGVVMDSAGGLFGATYFGGDSGFGTLFYVVP